MRILRKRKPLSDCKAFPIVHAHKDHGHGAHKSIMAIGCHKNECKCPICINFHSNRRYYRVRDIFANLENVVGEVSLLALTFTIPDTLRKLDSAKLATMRKAARKVLFTWLVEKYPSLVGWNFGGFDLFHPTGEDMELWSPHLHIELTNWAFHKSGAWFRFGLGATVEDLARLRSLWGTVLIRFGWRGDPACCVVQYAYARKQYMQNRLRYDVRHFAGWSGQERRICWFGFLSTRSKNLPKIKKEKLGRHDPRICPDCGAAAEFTMFGHGYLPDWVYHANQVSRYASGGVGWRYIPTRDLQNKLTNVFADRKEGL